MSVVDEKPSDVELLVGGASAVVLITLGVAMVYKAMSETEDTSTILQDASSLTALGAVVPL